MFRPATWLAFLLGLLAALESLATDPPRGTTLTREWRDGELVLYSSSSGEPNKRGERHVAVAAAGPARAEIREATLAALRERFAAWAAERQAAAEQAWHEASAELREKFDDSFEDFLRKYRWAPENEESFFETDFAEDGEAAIDSSLQIIFGRLAELEARGREGALERLAERLAAQAEDVSRNAARGPTAPRPPTVPVVPPPGGFTYSQGGAVYEIEAEPAVVLKLDDLDSIWSEIAPSKKSSKSSTRSSSHSSSGRSRVAPVLPAMGAAVGAYIILRSMTNRRVRLATRGY